LLRCGKASARAARRSTPLPYDFTKNLTDDEIKSGLWL